jgi:hypothetical protein
MEARPSEPEVLVPTSGLGPDMSGCRVTRLTHAELEPGRVVRRAAVAVVVPR